MDDDSLSSSFVQDEPRSKRRIAGRAIVAAALLAGFGAIAVTVSDSRAGARAGEQASTRLAASPSIKRFPKIAQLVTPSMNDEGGSNSYLLDVAASSVPGKEMAAGLYRIDAGPPLHYTYTYEEFKYVVEGEYHLEDGTGQKLVAKRGDLLYFPLGVNVTFSTPHSALGYFVGQRITPEPAVKITEAVRAAAAANPAIQLIGRIDTLSVPKLAEVAPSNFFYGDLAKSAVPGKEMAAGLYHLDAGPPLHYTYTYEEFTFVIEGQFEVEDGSGQRLVAEPGDLLYFPRGAEVIISTPHSALGHFVGQRKFM